MSGDKTGKERNLERLREESNLTYVRIQELYLAGRISKKEYEAYRRELFGGKTPLDYYSGLNEVLTRRRQVIRPVSRAPYVFLALFLILASFTVVFFQGGITGLVIGEQSRNYTLTYNTTFNSTTRMLFTASDILSLSASGTIEGDGHVAIYARTKDGALLIFERPALHSEDVEMNTTDKDVRVDNVTVDNVSDGNVGDQEVVDGNTADDNVSDDNVTADTVRDDVIDGNVVDQDVRVQDVTDGNVVDQAEETTTQYAFTSVCEETCLLPGITTTEIEVVLDGARLTLDSLSYTKRSRNSAPVQMKNISSFWMVDNVTLDSLRYFSDIDEDNLTFKIRPNPYVRLEQQGHDLFLYSTGIAGEYELFLTVSDGFEEVESNTFGVRVLIAEPLRRSMQENQSSPFVGVPVVWEKQLAYENLLNESLTESVSFTLPALIKNFTLVDEQTGKSIPADTLVSVQEGDAVTYSFSSDFLPEETQAYRVNYTTPAPEQREEALTPSKKRVVISADYPYENVTVRTQITPAPESAIRLYWIVDGEKQAFPINRYIDSDEDGNVDVIEWIVPHLSEQEFEVEIVILNVQSYPTVGGNWTVLFNTTGMADLTIAAVNGTTYNTSPNDLTPLELSCGGEVRSFSWTGNESVAYEDWECEGTGTWGVLVNTGGSHHQAFTFGNQTEYAHNYAGCGAAWCMDVNLGGTGDNHSNASFWGIEGSVEGEGGDISGSALTSVGDVNGDGYDDFVIGASGRNPGTGLDTGESYLVFGRASGWAMDTSVTSSNASFWGETGSDYAGYSVSGVGDVNGDGYDDFVIGANGRNPGPATRAGESYLVLGRASGWAMNTWLGNCAGGSDNCSNASFWGETASGYAGTSVSGVGDVNGDGYDDFVIGANHRNPGPGVNTGESYLVLGRASGWVMDVNLSGVGDNRSNASFWGEASGDSAGFSVSGVGDVNGDGYDDFVIGAPYRNLGPVASAGESYLVLGRASGWVMDVNLSGPGDNRSNASFWGEAKSDNAGRSVSGVGDVNGDGYDDFVIGAAADPNGAAGAGESYLILGRASGWVMDVNLSGPGDNRSNASFWGEAKSDNAGRSVSGVGDVNGDGYDDFLIGAYARKIGSAIFTGESYLVLGRASGWSLDVNLSGVGDNRSNASFWGEVAVDQAGTAVSGAGDVNGDGYDDFLIGAPIRDPGIGADSIGESYLILGQNSSFTPKTVSSITIYKDSAYSKSASGTNAYLSSSPQKLYIEVQATGKSSSVAEVAVVLVNSTSNGRTIKIKAIETGVNTNVFRAGFLVRTGASNREYIKIGAANESTLFVKSWDDQTKSSSTTILYGVTDQCDPSGAWTISSSLSCQGTRITASSLTINAGGILLLNDTSLNVSGDTIIASGGGLDVLNSKGSIWFSDNVTISGYANFSNATVHMNGSCDGCVALNVTSTGVLVINASTNLTAGVDSTKNYYFEVQKGGNLTILDSNVEFVGWMDAGSADARSGMTLRNNGSVIRNSTFFNNFYDILIRGNSSVIDNVTLTGVRGLYTLGAFDCEKNNITNSVLSSGTQGVAIYTCHNNTFENVSMNGPSDRDAFYFESAHGNIIRNATITSARVALNGGALSLSSSDRTLVENVRLTVSNGGKAAYITASTGTVFIDTAFSSGGTGKDIREVDASGSYKTLVLNSTIDPTKVDTGNGVQVFIRNYVNANVTDATGAAISGANVSIRNVTNAEENWSLTSASGLSGIINVTTVVVSGLSDTRTYYTNYSANASKDPYFNNSQTYNVTARTTINLTLATVCEATGQDVTITSSMSCTNANMSFGTLTINAGGRLFLNKSNMNVSGDTTIASGGSLDVFNSKGTVWFSDNVTISGSANFSNATVRMNGTCDGCVRMNVTATGSLIINSSSNITNGATAAAEYLIHIQPGANFTMIDSYLSEAGYTEGAYDYDLSGVYIDGVNASIRNSTFQNNYVHFVLWHADNASVVNNTFLSTDSEYGVYHFFSNFSNYSDNRFTLGASAIYMESSSNVSIAHLGLTSSGDDKGLYLVDVNATNGTDINLTMANGADGTGLYLLRSHRNSFNRVRVETQETTSATKGALYLHSSDNNTFNNSYFYAPNLNAVVGDIQVPFPGPAGNVIQDSALFSGEELTDYDLLLNAYTNITLINTSYATNDVSFGTASNLYYKNYLKVGVKDSQNGSLLKFVNVTVMNLSGVEEFNDFTDANGETSFHTLMSWKQNSSGFEYYSNYTMNFSLVEYQNGTGTVNLTGRMIHNVTMSPLCYFNGNAMYLEENLTCENTTGKLSSLEITPFAKLRLVNVSLNISGQIIVRDNAVFDVINASFGKGGIRVAGNISVNGTFNFTDSALGMNLTCASCAAGTERTGLNISGNIIINRSNITKAEPLHENYSFVVYALGNISVQNSRIENAGWASPSAAGDPAGGLLIYANNSLIRNTTFYNNSYDLRLVAANNSFIYNNSFKSPTNGYSVLLYSSSRYNNISNNYFNGSLTAIYLSASDNNSFEQNWMNGSFNGMYFSSSNNNTVKYATIYSAGAGMQFISSGYNHVENVNLSESVNNYGLFLGGNRNYFRDLRVSSRSGNSSAMFINAASTNEVFRSTIESVDTGALVVNRGTSNLFTDVAFTSGPIGYDIEGVYGSGTYYTSLVNCTFNWNDVGSAAGDRIQARDYFNVYVSDNSGALSGVNVSVHNLTYQLENWSLTNSSGLTGVLNYTVFHHINTVRSEYNNYTVLVRKDGYHTRNLSVNVSKGKPYNITMNATPAFLGVVADPSPLGYGYNVTIEVNVTDPDGDTDITSVLVEIDPPGTPVATNQTMTLIEDFGSGLRYRYNHTDWYNGTYNYKIYVKDTTNNWVNSTTYTFDLWTNMSLQTRTVNGSYIRDEIINLTNGTGEDLSVVFNNGSTSTKVYLVMWVQFFNATDLKWYDEALVWNTTWTFNLTAGQNITLANYWNGKVNTSENLTKGSGWYRVNISLHSNSSVILKNYSGYNLSYTYNFSYFNNSLPALKTVQLLPGTAYTTTTLTLYANCTDPDVSDTINAVYTFYKDGVNTSSGAQVVTNGVNTSVGTVAPASTAKGETWTGSVSCKDGTNSTAYTNTSDVLILNSVPTLPVHDSPSTENFTVHERYTFFNWTNSTDDDGDTIVYEINVSTDTACAGGGFNQSWLDRTNTSAPKALCTHDETALIYNWTVRACDDETCTAWTTRWNFSIQPWIVIVFTNDNVDFGEIAFTQVNQWNDTSDDKPLPFTIENTGNVLTNLTNVTANASLWLDPQAGLGTHYFQIKVANTTEADSFDWQASQTTYMNLTANNQSLIDNLDWNTSRNSAEIDINITLPSQEPAGNKSADIILWFEQN